MTNKVTPAVLVGGTTGKAVIAAETAGAARGAIGVDLTTLGRLAVASTWTAPQTFGTVTTGALTVSGAVTINADDVDFVVRDTTDAQSNFIWRNHAAGSLNIGTSNAVPTLRADLRAATHNSYDVGQTTTRFRTVYGENLVLGRDSLSLDMTLTGQEGLSIRSDADGSQISMYRTGDAAMRLGRNGTGEVAFFYRSGGGAVGNISVTASATAYNTSSDYRLKSQIVSLTGFSERLDALKPRAFVMGGEPTRGFIAHEFATVYPNSVTGEKDAVDADGKPIYQSMQASTSEVMADLIAEVQSLRQRVAALEAG